MSLDGAKLICLSDATGDQGDIIYGQGRTFKFGYYMDCDVVLEHPDALGLQCTIDCDAFGRITIENRCPDVPITLDGKILRKMRPLLHSTEICILNKKYLWHFEGNTHPGGFQSEDVSDFKTPCKLMKKAEQPPNSEPARMWRTQFPKRLTIHSFAYCIKAGESPLDVEVTADENKPLNTYERIIVDAEPSSSKRLSPVASDLIDLKTPKARQRSFAGRKTPLSCCNLSETVITSYSPRETGVRPEKSFAIVQSPSITPKKSATQSDVTLSTFQHVSSPLTYNHRPSMHLIDLTTPMKRAPPASPTLLKAALKKNILKGKQQTPQQQQPRSTTDSSPASLDSSVFSVHSTDESVIEVSDEGGFSSPTVLKTPPRVRTPQSLMKRAILSSAKKAAITKRLQQPIKPPLPILATPRNPPIAVTEVHFQSQSTPQRKSLGRFQSPAESLLKASHSVLGKSRKSMITSTPFRTGETIPTTCRQSSILRSPSTSLTGVKNKSRTSLMLKQALSKSPQKSSAQKRKSVTFLETTKSPVRSVLMARKSVSFLDRIQSEQSEDNQSLNETFSIEVVDQTDVPEMISTPRKDATFSPEKEKCDGGKPNKDVVNLPSIVITDEKESVLNQCEDKNKTSAQDIETESQNEKSVKPNVTFSPDKTNSSFVPETPANRKDTKKRQSTFKELPDASSSSKRSKTDVNTTVESSRVNVTFSPDKKDGSCVSKAVTETPKATSSTAQTDDEAPQSAAKLNESSIPQTPQSSRSRLKFINTTTDVSQSISNAKQLKSPKVNAIEDDDFEGLDTIFKTPKARNIMIMSSPKSISLQKPTPDSVELVHSTEFDLSANLDDIFMTPQSELIINRIVPESTPATTGPLSPEEAFDKLVGRPTTKRTYVRKTPPKKEELPALNVPKDPTVPNTDIEEWLDKVNELLGDGDEQDEDEMSYLTATQNELSRDPLMTTSISGSVNTTTRKKLVRSPKDESAMTIQEEDEEETLENSSALKDPLEISKISLKRPMSPNISGIDVLDHTSESIFSDTLAVSDESSGGKEVDKTVKVSLDETITNEDEDDANKVSPNKALRDMEKAFEHFENERRILEGKRLVSTPEPKKPPSRDLKRRTLGNQPTLHSFFDAKSLKADREIEIAFETFEENPKRNLAERLVKTPEIKKTVRKNTRKTMGNPVESSFDVGLAKAEREMELAFENFEEKPAFSGERAVQTPEPEKTVPRDHRGTTGSGLVSEVKLDLKAAKAERDMKLAFENFEEDPEFTEERAVKTPEPELKKTSLKDHRRTLGSSLVSKVKLDMKAAKAERDMELAFENFEEKPAVLKERGVKTPEPEKAIVKDHRNTLGSGLVSEMKFDLNAAIAEREMKLAFENFEEVPEFTEERAVKTPEPELKKTSLKDHRRTMGSSLVSEVKLDMKAAKAEREKELAFENFEEKPAVLKVRVVKTPEPENMIVKDHRRTLGSSLVSEVKLDLKVAKAERDMELAFENFKEKPTVLKERVVKTPEPEKVTVKDHRRTLGSSLVSEMKFDLNAAIAEREMELAFENFEEDPEFTEERAVKTPEPELKKTSLKDHRRTMGSSLVSEVKLDLKAAKAEQDMELAFENFEEKPTVLKERVVKTPEPKKVTVKDHRRTLGSGLVSEIKFDLNAAIAEREMELAFENFEEDPEFTEERAVKTPEPELKKTSLKDHRRTMGSSLVSAVKLDMNAAKAERDMELTFENFEEKPTVLKERVVKTPEPEKVTVKDHRRTLGSGLVSELKFDLNAALPEREMELAFENIEEDPEFTEERAVKTPEPELKKTSLKDHRRTMGSSLVSEVKLDMKTMKAEPEKELAFENFEEKPAVLKERLVKTPEPENMIVKDHRRTLGSGLVSEVKLDLKAAKAEREMELAFENFEEEPEFTKERAVHTPEPEPKKKSLKHHRRTMGSNLVSEVKFDLNAAIVERDMELAFENFEEEPEFTEERGVKTPEPELKKMSLKDHRRTMGSSNVSEVKLDLKAARAEREMELAFENFEEEPEFTEERAVQTPEPKKKSSKDHRRTMGSSMVSEVKLDLKAAKAEREMELAFENFEEEPEFTEERAVQTPEPKKKSLKDHRRTMGSSMVSEVKLDLKAAKAEREKELEFENFEEEPEFTEDRAVQTPEPKKKSSKDHRRTMGSSMVSEVKLDLKAAKAEREMELAFENFEEEPEFTEERDVQTPEPKKKPSKDHRRTMGSSMESEVKLDLKAAKAEREMELAFENFEEEPEFKEERAVHTPEPKKKSSKDHRRTMGSSMVSEVKLDLKAAKAEREMELAFENFEDEPEFIGERAVQTPEPKKKSSKDHRRTMGSSMVSEVKLDLEAAKAEREMELAFENFEEEPEFTEERAVQTPEPKKKSSKDHRRTMGSSMVSEVKLDLKAAKAEREMNLAFENFEEEPEFTEERHVQTPEPKKKPSKDHRRTMGSSMESEVKLDLKAAKAEREMELAFENFEEEPEFKEERAVHTPEPKKKSSKDHRRTMGSSMVSEVKLDLKAAKAEREMELAFENFEDEPEFIGERAVQTPEPKKKSSKDHRRTMGSSMVSEVKLDLEAAKAEREMELAFENFEEEPEFKEERAVQTPEPKKKSSKDHRRTMGSSMVSEVKLDLKAAKAEREMELAFENFEEEPEFIEERAVQTPEPKKKSSKDHRRTMESSMVSEVKLDLKAAKAEREMELAFENFEEEPEFTEERAVQTPEPKKKFSKDHRRTMGSSIVSEVKLDLKAAKAEREIELAFENFEEEPEFTEDRAAQTPESKKMSLKDHRRTMGSSLVSEVKLDLKAEKARHDMELAFKNFDEEPEFSGERIARTPEVKKAILKDHRRTMGSSLVSEVKLDLTAEKTRCDVELAFENFKEDPEFSKERSVQTPDNIKSSLKDHRRTVGTKFVPEVKLDTEAHSVEKEMELIFKDFPEEGQVAMGRLAKTPDLKNLGNGQMFKSEQVVERISEEETTMNKVNAVTEKNCEVIELKYQQGEKLDCTTECQISLGNEKSIEPKILSKQLTTEPATISRKAIEDMGTEEQQEDISSRDKIKKEDAIIHSDITHRSETSTDEVTHPRSRRKRKNTGDEDAKPQEEKTTIPDPPGAIRSQSRKRRQKTIDEAEKIEENKEESNSSTTSTNPPTKTRRVRRPTKDDLEQKACDLKPRLKEEIVTTELKTQHNETDDELLNHKRDEITEDVDAELMKSQKTDSLSDLQETDKLEKPRAKREMGENQVDVRFASGSDTTIKDDKSQRNEAPDSKNSVDVTKLKEEKETVSQTEVDPVVLTEIVRVEEDVNFKRAGTPSGLKPQDKAMMSTWPPISVDVSSNLKEASHLCERQVDLKNDTKAEQPVELATTEVENTQRNQETDEKKRDHSSSQLKIQDKQVTTITRRQNLVDMSSNLKREEHRDAGLHVETAAKAEDEKTRRKQTEGGDTSSQLRNSVDASSNLSREDHKDAGLHVESAAKAEDEKARRKQTEGGDTSSQIRKRTTRQNSVDVSSNLKREDHRDRGLHVETVAKTEDEKSIRNQIRNTSSQLKTKTRRQNSVDVSSNVKGEDPSDVGNPVENAAITEDQADDTSSQQRKRTKRLNSVDVSNVKGEGHRETATKPQRNQTANETQGGDTSSQLRKRTTRQNSVDVSSNIKGEDNNDARLPEEKTDNSDDENTRMKIDGIQGDNTSLQLKTKTRRRNSVDVSANLKCEDHRAADLHVETAPKLEGEKSQRNQAADEIQDGNISSQPKTKTGRQHFVDVHSNLDKEVELYTSERSTSLQKDVDNTVREGAIQTPCEETPLNTRKQSQSPVDEDTDGKAGAKAKTNQFVNTSSHPSRNRRKNSTSEDDMDTNDDVEPQKITGEIDSTGLDSTEDETQHALTTRKKRLRKIATTPLSQVEAEIHNHLETIVEEKRLGTPTADQDVIADDSAKITTRPIRSIVGRKEDAPKTVLNLQADVGDFILSSPITSSNRFRGRKAQLNVVLVESKGSQNVLGAEKKEAMPTYSVKMEPTEEEKHNDESRIDSEALEHQIEKDNVEDVIPSTPVTLTTRGRRLPIKVASAESAAPATKRGRRGSTQVELSEIEIKAEPVDEEEIISSTPVPSKTRGRKGVLKVEPEEKSTPTRNTGRKEGNTAEADGEEVIQSTPVLSKTRGRRAELKSEPIENAAPTRKRGRRKAVEEVNAHTLVGSTPGDDAVHDEDAQVNVEEIAEEKPRGRRQKLVVSESSTHEVPLKTRGRKAAIKTESKEFSAEGSTPARRGDQKGVGEEAVVTIDAGEIPSLQTPESLPEVVVNSAPAASTPEDVTEHNIGVETKQVDVEDVVSLQVPQNSRGRRQKLTEAVTEISTPEIRQSTQVPLKTRGRRAAVKSESNESSAEGSTPARRGGRKGVGEEAVVKIDADEIPSTQTPESLPEVVVNSAPADSTPEEVTEHNIGVETKQVVVEDVVPLRVSQNSRGRRQKLTEAVTGISAPEVRQSTQVPLKTRGRRAAVKTESNESSAEGSTPARRGGRKGVGEEAVVTIDTDEIPLTQTTEHTPEDVTEHNVGVDAEDVVSLQVSQNARGRRQKLTETVTESSTPEVRQSKTRGRRAALKSENTESSTPSRRAIDREAAEVNATVEEVVPPTQPSERIAAVIASTVGGSTPGDIRVKLGKTDVDEEGPSKTRGRRAAQKDELVIKSLTPAQTRVRRHVVDEGSPPLSNAHGDPGALKLEPTVSAAESSSSSRKRGQRGAVLQEHVSYKEEDDVEKVVTTSSKSETAKSTIESSLTGGESMSVQPNCKIPLEHKKVIPIKRTRRGVDAEPHVVEAEIEKVVPSKRGRRGVPEAHSEEADIENVGQPKKQEPAKPDHSKNSPKSSQSGGVQPDSGINTEEDGIEQKVPPRKRGRPVKVVGHTTEADPTKRGQRGAVEDNTGKMESDAEEGIQSKKRGRQAILKSEATDSAAENSTTPARKRGRRGAVQEDVHESKPKTNQSQISDVEEAAPVPSRGRQMHLKVESTVKSVTAGQKGTSKAKSNISVNKVDDVEEATGSTPPEAESNSRSLSSHGASSSTKTPQGVSEEDKSKKKPTRSRRALDTTSPSYVVSEEEQIHTVTTQTDKKPVRGRRVPQTDTTTSLHTDEEAPVSATKSKTTRGRKVVTKADTSSERENVEGNKNTPTTVRGRKANTVEVAGVEARVPVPDPSEDDIEKRQPECVQPAKKPTRGRKVKQVKPDTAADSNPEVVSDENNPTKTTRGRKAATAKALKESDDEQPQSETLKKPTRSRKVEEAPKEAEKPAPKRGNRRNLEVQAEDELDNTPSKRIRRKPNILLSDEFVR